MTTLKKKFNCLICKQTFEEISDDKILKIINPKNKKPNFETICEDCFVDFVFWAKENNVQFEEQFRSLKNLTWVCSSCNKERPDEFISVYSHKHTAENGITFTHNSKYCNDNPECKLAVHKMCENMYWWKLK